MLGIALHLPIRSIPSVSTSKCLNAHSWTLFWLAVNALNRISQILSFLRRQNGQLILAPMAVVVQEMVDPDAAGIVFSRDPVSGNPTHIVITANYGLGEVNCLSDYQTQIVSLKLLIFSHVSQPVHNFQYWYECVKKFVHLYNQITSKKHQLKFCLSYLLRKNNPIWQHCLKTEQVFFTCLKIGL